MRRVIVLCSFFWVLGLNICAQEDLSRSTATTTTIVENPDKYKVETNRFWSNWFVSVGGGALMYFGDHNKQMSFGDRWLSLIHI